MWPISCMMTLRSPSPINTCTIDKHDKHDKPNPQALQGIPAELGESMGKANQTCTECGSTPLNTVPFLQSERTPPAALPSWVQWQPRAKERCHASATHRMFQKKHFVFSRCTSDQADSSFHLYCQPRIDKT